MGKQYFKKLAKYMKQVYNIEDGLGKLEDRRVNPSYSAKQVALHVLLGFILRIQSFNQLNGMLKSNDFKNVVSKKTKLPLIDTIGDMLKTIVVKGIAKLNAGIIKKSIENKAFRQGTIDGYTVAALDGTMLFNSTKKSCSKCSTSTKGERTHYSHSAVFLSIIGMAPRLVLDFELYKSDLDSSALIQIFLYRKLRGFIQSRRTQKEIIRLLEKGLHLLEYDREYIFSSA